MVGQSFAARQCVSTLYKTWDNTPLTYGRKNHQQYNFNIKWRFNNKVRCFFIAKICHSHIRNGGLIKMGQIYGYVRVSSLGQNKERQIIE